MFKKGRFCACPHGYVDILLLQKLIDRISNLNRPMSFNNRPERILIFYETGKIQCQSTFFFLKSSIPTYRKSFGQNVTTRISNSVLWKHPFFLLHWRTVTSPTLLKSRKPDPAPNCIQILGNLILFWTSVLCQHIVPAFECSRGSSKMAEMKGEIPFSSWFKEIVRRVGLFLGLLEVCCRGQRQAFFFRALIARKGSENPASSFCNCDFRLFQLQKITATNSVLLWQNLIRFGVEAQCALRPKVPLLMWLLYPFRNRAGSAA